MALRYSLALPACVLENLKARKAIRRSIELSRGARGRIFVLLLLIGVIKIGLVLVTQFFVFVAAFRNHGQLGPGISAISQIISFFTNTFLGPIGATGITLFYYDQRIRKEGFDIEWMMQAAGLTPPAPPAPESPADHLSRSRRKARMNEPLHPSTLGEILDRTVHLYRSRFLVLLGIAFIPTGVVLALAVVYFLLFALVGSRRSIHVAGGDWHCGCSWSLALCWWLFRC